MAQIAQHVMLVSTWIRAVVQPVTRDVHNVQQIQQIACLVDSDTFNQVANAIADLVDFTMEVVARLAIQDVFNAPPIQQIANHAWPDWLYQVRFAIVRKGRSSMEQNATHVTQDAQIAR